MTAQLSTPNKARLSALALLTIATLFVGVPATADRRAFLDEDDSAGPLDLVAATHGHKTTERGTQLLVHGVVTYEKWATEDDVGTFSFGFNTDRDDVFERGVVVSYHDGKLTAKVFNRRGEGEGTIGYARVWRPDEHSVKIGIPRWLMKRHNLTFYRWFARSHAQTEELECQLGCTDELPGSPSARERRTILHDLR